MRKRIRPLISTSVLVIMIGAIFFAGKPQPLYAQNAPFKSYQLRVFCENAQVATATFWYDVKEQSMGLKSICAGNCPEGTVTIADALAGLPPEVSAALKAMVEKHQENAAAGKGQSLACLRDGKEPPPEDKNPKCEAAKCEPPKEGGPKFKSSVSGYNFYPFENSPHDLVPQQECPGCLWELVVADLTSRDTEEGKRNIMSGIPEKFTCNYRYLSVWRCPSNGIVVPMRNYKKVGERCRAPQ